MNLLPLFLSCANGTGHSTAPISAQIRSHQAEKLQVNEPHRLPAADRVTSQVRSLARTPGPSRSIASAGVSLSPVEPVHDACHVRPRPTDPFHLGGDIRCG